VRRNASVKTHSKGVAKNLAGNRLLKLAFCGHFRRVAESGQKLMIMAGLSLFQIVPGHPCRRIRRQFTGVPLKLGEVVKRICAREFTSVDQAHEQIPGFGAVQGAIEQSILAMQHGAFQRAFADMLSNGAPASRRNAVRAFQWRSK